MFSFRPCCLLTALLLLSCINLQAQCSPENALYFTESLDRLSVHHDVVGEGIPYTFEIWVRDDAPANDFSLNRIANLGRFTDSSLDRIELGTEGGELAIFLGTSVIGSGVDIRDDEWHHVALTSDGAVLTIYLDGDNVLETPDDSQLRSSIVIGSWNVTDTDAQWIGPMDEIRVWSVTRTQEQIMTNMNCRYEGNEDGLRSYVRANAGEAGGNNTQITTLPELTGNNNDATLGGFNLTGNESNFVVAGWVDASCPSSSGAVCADLDIALTTTVAIDAQTSVCCPTYSYENTSGRAINGFRIRQIAGNAIDQMTISSPVGLVVSETDAEGNIILRLPDSSIVADTPGELLSFCFTQNDPPVTNTPMIAVEPLSLYDLGCQACSDTISFDCILSDVVGFSTQRSFTVSPNPTTDLLFIEGITNVQPLSFELRDVMGRLLERTTTGNQVNISGLPAATYYLIVTNTEGQREVYPVVKR